MLKMRQAHQIQEWKMDLVTKLKRVWCPHVSLFGKKGEAKVG